MVLKRTKVVCFGGLTSLLLGGLSLLWFGCWFLWCLRFLGFGRLLLGCLCLLWLGCLRFSCRLLLGCLSFLGLRCCLLLWGLRLLWFSGLFGWLLGFLDLCLVNLVGSLDLLQFSIFNGFFQELAEEGSKLGYVAFVVGCHVLLDGCQRGTISLLQSSDRRYHHGCHWWMGSWCLWFPGLGSLLGCCCVRHGEFLLWCR